jgi:hypothetical protein
VKDIQFANALARGLIGFAKFLDAKKITTDSIQPAGLRKEIEKQVRASL